MKRNVKISSDSDESKCSSDVKFSSSCVVIQKYQGIHHASWHKAFFFHLSTSLMFGHCQHSTKRQLYETTRRADMYTMHHEAHTVQFWERGLQPLWHHRRHLHFQTTILCRQNRLQTLYHIFFFFFFFLKPPIAEWTHNQLTKSFMKTANVQTTQKTEDRLIRPWQTRPLSQLVKKGSTTPRWSAPTPSDHWRNRPRPFLKLYRIASIKLSSEMHPMSFKCLLSSPLHVFNENKFSRQMTRSLPWAHGHVRLEPFCTDCLANQKRCTLPFQQNAGLFQRLFTAMRF